MSTHTTHIYKKVDPTTNSTEVYQERVINDRPVTYRSESAASGVIYFLLNVVEVLLAARFLFKVFGANPSTPFTNFLYSLTAPLIAPFRGIFPSSTPSGALIEWSTIVAMIVYALIAYAIVKVIESAYSATER